MERPIRHVHERRFAAPLAEVIAAVDALWSGTSGDALPRALRGWRKNPAGLRGLAVGTRFGHGPFSFEVEQWDGETLRARIETTGFRGHHGFKLRCEGSEVVVSHDLDAHVTLVRWLFWQLFLASGHDWAVASMLDRMRGLLGDERASMSAPHVPPFGMRAFAAMRRFM